MQPQASHPLHLTPLADLLGRAGAALTDIAGAVEQLHPLAAAHASTPSMDGATPPAGLTSAPAPDYVQALQGIDHIEQKLRALAGFLEDLAQAAAEDWQLDAQPALAAITLSDLAAHLAGHTPLQARQGAIASGDLEMF